jgi:hypothetical protein
MEELFIEKTAGIGKKLSDDPSQWVKEIITEFHNEYPELEQVKKEINFNQKDDEKGTAVGSLVLPDWSVAIPIVIESGYLYPLDIAVFQNKILPFNKNSIGLLFQNKSAFSSVSNLPESEGKLRRIFGRNLESIEKISEYDPEEFINKIAGTLTSEQREIAGIGGEFVPDFYVLEKIGKWDYVARLGAVGDDFEQKIELDERDLDHFKEKMTNLGVTEGRSGEFYKKANVGVVSTANLIDFDGNELDVSIKFNESGDYSMDFEKTSEYDINIDEKSVIEAKNVKTGDFGVFLFNNGVSKPVSIEKVGEYMKGVEIEAFDGLDMRNIHILDGVDEFGMDSKTKFVKLGRLKENVKDYDINVGKNYALEKDGSYNFYGDAFDAGSERVVLSAEDARFEFLRRGGVDDEFNKIAGNWVIQSDLRPIIKNEPLVDTERFAKLAAKAKKSNVNPKTVDAILGLGFLNKKNLKYFVERLPMFEETAGDLAYLLLAARLGVETVDSDTVKDAMEAMSEVIVQLYQMNNIVK